MRAVIRSIYVVLVTFVAICLPFFADLMGLIGAIGFTPMTFVLPCVFWLKVGPHHPICKLPSNLIKVCCHLKISPFSCQMSQLCVAICGLVHMDTALTGL